MRLCQDVEVTSFFSFFSFFAGVSFSSFTGEPFLLVGSLRSPSFSLSLASISSHISGFSIRNVLEFARPCPMRVSLYENHEPLLFTSSWVTARSSKSPILEMPCPYNISNSQSLNGGATLFLTTFTLVRYQLRYRHL